MAGMSDDGALIPYGMGPDCFPSGRPIRNLIPMRRGAQSFGAWLHTLGLVMDHHGRLVIPGSEPLPCELCRGCRKCTHECACPDDGEWV